MSEPPPREDRGPGRRLLVALEADQASMALLEAAARLAAGLERELVGLFLADEALLAAAGLPFIRLVSRSAPHEDLPFDPRSTRRINKVLAARVRGELARHAEARRVRWSFHIVEGGLVGLELRTSDVLAWLLARPRPLDPAEAAGPVLPCPVVLPGRDRDGPVLVLYDGSPEALDLGRRIADAEGRPLQVLTLGDDATTSRERAAEASRQLEPRAAVPVETLGDGDRLDRLEAAIRERRPSLIVLDARHAQHRWHAVIAAVAPPAAAPRPAPGKRPDD